MVQLKKKLSGKMRVKSLPPVAGTGEMPEPDVEVVTSDGVRIPAHSKILVLSLLWNPCKFISFSLLLDVFTLSFCQLWNPAKSFSFSFSFFAFFFYSDGF